eukprot:c5078_g1_i1 orf=3-179(-)
MYTCLRLVLCFHMVGLFSDSEKWCCFASSKPPSSSVQTIEVLLEDLQQKMRLRASLFLT